MGGVYWDLEDIPSSTLTKESLRGHGLLRELYPMPAAAAVGGAVVAASILSSSVPLDFAEKGRLL